MEQQQQYKIGNYGFFDGYHQLIPEALKSAEITKDPILIVGLGGTGGEAVVNIKSRMMQTFKKNPDNSTYNYNNIGFLVLDADKATFRTGVSSFLSRGASLNEDKKLFLDWTSFPAWLENNYESDFMSTWFPSYILDDRYNSRVRSRALLFYNFNTVFEKFKSLIGKLLGSIDINNPTLKVFVISSLDGSTGSGICIDIAYIIRKAMGCCINADNQAVNACMDIFGYFATADKYHYSKEHSAMNAYATLKELNYLMGNDCGLKWDQVYNSKGFEIKSSSKPFDLVNLAFMNDDAPDDNLLAISEEILIFMHNNSADSLSPVSHISQLKAAQNEFCSRLEQKRMLKPAYYEFRVIGNSGVTMPYHLLTINIASRILKGVSSATNAHTPTQKEVEILSSGSYLGIDVPSLTKRISAFVYEEFSDVLIYPDKYPELSPKEIKKGLNVSERFEAILSRMQQKMKEYVSGDDFFADVKESFMHQLKPLFTNKVNMDVVTGEDNCEYGPLFVAQLLNGSCSEFVYNLANLCKSMRCKLKEECKAISEAIPMLEASANELLDEFRNFVLVNKNRYTWCMNAMIILYEQKYKLYLYDELIAFYDRLCGFIVDLASNNVSPVFDALDKYKEMFDEQVKCYSDERYLRSFDKRSALTYQQVDSLLNTFPVLCDANENTSMFYSYIWEAIEDQILKGNDDCDIDIVNFIFKNYSYIYNCTLEDVLKANGSIEEFLADLYKKAKPLFNVGNPFDEITFLGNDNSVCIIDTPPASNEINIALTNLNMPKPANYNFSGDISFYRSNLFVPLYIYGGLKELERSYERYARGRGVHLYCVGENHWINLPNIIIPNDKN